MCIVCVCVCGLNRDLLQHSFLTLILTSLSVPSGIDELSKTGFEFISHSLLGSPLSRELGITGRGLQGGALLITGAKVSPYIAIVIIIMILLTTQLFKWIHILNRIVGFCLTHTVSSKGSGKSTLSRALCGEAREHLDAHVEVVDCKKLQGRWILHTQTDQHIARSMCLS